MPDNIIIMMPFPGFRGRLSGKQARMLSIVDFLARLVILSLPLYLVIWLGLDLYPLQAAAASQSAWIMQGLGYQVVHEGAGILMGNGFRFFIIPDCTGWKSMLFLFALVFAVPGIGIRKRLAGLLAGLPIIWLANIGRIVSVVNLQAAWGTDAAIFLHDTFFQLALVFLVMGLWSAWLLWSKNRLRSISCAFSRQR
jgi:exosortase/archaeosortase family protein